MEKPTFKDLLLQTETTIKGLEEFTRSQLQADIFEIVNYEYAHVYEDMFGSLSVYMTRSWRVNLDSSICSEWWIKKILCKIAHGNECGSRQYVALKNRIEVGAKYLENLYKSSSMLRDKVRIIDRLDISREQMCLSVDVKLEVLEDYLSDWICEERKKIYAEAQKIMLIRDFEQLEEDLFPAFFANYKRMLTEELGIKNISIEIKRRN